MQGAQAQGMDFSHAGRIALAGDVLLDEGQDGLLPVVQG
jgi:hypothetical protein